MMNNQRFHQQQVYNKNIKLKIDLVRKSKNRLLLIKIVKGLVRI